MRDHPRRGLVNPPAGRGEPDGLFTSRYLAAGVSAASAVVAGSTLVARMRAAWRDAERGHSEPSREQLISIAGSARHLYNSPPLLEPQPYAEPEGGHVTVNIDREILGGDGDEGSAGVAIRDVVARLNAAVHDDRWSLAEAAAERTIELALQAVIGGDQPALRELGSEVRKLRFKLILNQEMSEVPTAEKIVGMLAGMSALIALAELAPPPAEARNVAEAILQTLLRKQQLTTTELAKECSYRQETVARTLTHLRKAGLVLSAKAGRNKQNSLTASGRRRALELRNEQPISLRRPSWNDQPDCAPISAAALLVPELQS